MSVLGWLKQYWWKEVPVCLHTETTMPVLGRVVPLWQVPYTQCKESVESPKPLVKKLKKLTRKAQARRSDGHVKKGKGSWTR